MEEKAAHPETFLTITTYGMAQRLEGLKQVHWAAEIPRISRTPIPARPER